MRKEFTNHLSENRTLMSFYQEGFGDELFKALQKHDCIICLCPKAKLFSEEVCAKIKSDDLESGGVLGFDEGGFVVAQTAARGHKDFDVTPLSSALESCGVYDVEQSSHTQYVGIDLQDLASGKGDVWLVTEAGDLRHLRPNYRFSCSLAGWPLFVRSTCMKVTGSVQSWLPYSIQGKFFMRTVVFRCPPWLLCLR
eukprot:scaffold68055_cov60-Cyclotella_meneghiniana.AAC.3